MTRKPDEAVESIKDNDANYSHGSLVIGCLPIMIGKPLFSVTCLFKYSLYDQINLWAKFPSEQLPGAGLPGSLQRLHIGGRKPALAADMPENQPPGEPETYKRTENQRQGMREHRLYKSLLHLHISKLDTLNSLSELLKSVQSVP